MKEVTFEEMMEAVVLGGEVAEVEIGETYVIKLRYSAAGLEYKSIHSTAGFEAVRGLLANIVSAKKYWTEDNIEVDLRQAIRFLYVASADRSARGGVCHVVDADGREVWYDRDSCTFFVSNSDPGEEPIRSLWEFYTEPEHRFKVNSEVYTDVIEEYERECL